MTSPGAGLGRAEEPVGAEPDWLGGDRDLPSAPPSRSWEAPPAPHSAPWCPRWACHPASPRLGSGCVSGGGAFGEVWLCPTLAVTGPGRGDTCKGTSLELRRLQTLCEVGGNWTFTSTTPKQIYTFSLKMCMSDTCQRDDPTSYPYPLLAPPNPGSPVSCRLPGGSETGRRYLRHGAPCGSRRTLTCVRVCACMRVLLGRRQQEPPPLQLAPR